MEAYVITTILLPIQYKFINNYIDGDQFNTLYNEDFEIKRIHIADKIIY